MVVSVSVYGICFCSHQPFLFARYDLPPPSWAVSADTALSKGSLIAPMPGRITRISAKAGQAVKQGDVILALEVLGFLVRFVSF